MGTPISKLRKETDLHEFVIEKELIQQRLQILEKMINYHLDGFKNEILNGNRSDQETDNGMVLEIDRQINIKLGGRPSQDLVEALRNYLSQSNTEEGFIRDLHLALDPVLGDTSIGEHEGSNMFIVWSDHAILRLDVYCYRWNFSSMETIEELEGASGTIIIKRVKEREKQWRNWREANELMGNLRSCRLRLFNCTIVVVY